MLTETDLEKICDFIFNESTASETEVIYSEYESSTTRFSSNVITQNLNQKNRSLTIRVIHEKREGTAECNELNHDTLRNTLEKAMESRAYQHPNNELLPLAQPQEYQTVSNYHEKTAFLTPLEKVEWIKTATQKAKELQMESSGIFDSGWKLYSIANSHGLKAYHKYSMADFNYSVEKDKASGWYEMSSHSIDNINLNTIIDKALDSAIKSESPTDIKPGDYTVILTAEALSELFYFLVFYGLNTVGILEKSNFFHDKLGEKVLSDKLSLEDNAFHELSGGLPFDFEGSARQKVNLIENGVFRERVLDRKLAGDLGLSSTGHALPQPNSHGPFSLNSVMKPGEKSLEEMIKSTEYGLFVNRFHYTNLLDPMNLNLTGMTRDGLFLIENGVITQPVKNLRFTESLVKALNSIEYVENKSTFVRSFFGGGFVLSGVKLNSFHFSSATDF